MIDSTLDAELDSIRHAAADAVFDRRAAVRDETYTELQSEHGGYWHRDFVDHAYLYNLYFPPDSLLEGMQAQMRQIVLNYPVGQDAIAALVGRLIGQPADHLVVGNGAAEIIKILSGQLARKLIVPVPSFNEYINAAPPRNVIEFELPAPGFSLDVERFAADARRRGADFAVVVTPNNPTSLQVPRSDLLRLLDLLDEQRCTLVVDESFIDFADEAAAESLERDIERYRNLAVIKSMSKAYGICGLRIGYLLSSNEVLISQLRDGLHIWNINGFAEAFLRVAPDYRQDFIESCDRVRSDRDGLYEQLCAIPGMDVWEPDANFVFCRLPDASPTGPEVARRLFTEANILVKHCVGKSMPDSDRYLRLAVRTPAENAALVHALVRTVGASPAL